ncbi:MAG: hypothetical protein AB1529_08205 [Candidatus Micrarchaeota archaeon]
MFPIVKQARMKLSKTEFARLSAELGNRGFVDTLPGRKDANVVRHDGYPLARLSRQISGFELIVECFMRLDTIQGPEGIISGGLVMKVLFEGAAERNVDMLLRCFRGKCHCLKGDGYSATMLPSLDAGQLIKAGLAMEDALGMIRSDQGIGQALDAFEVAEKLDAGLRGIGAANQYKGAAGAHLNPFITAYRRFYNDTLIRLASEPRILAAMENVAERD